MAPGPTDLSAAVGGTRRGGCAYAPFVGEYGQGDHGDGADIVYSTVGDRASSTGPRRMGVR